jgi:tRNA-Thr(GGU) m(6)t(6)A37 methyltransferase TsaA
MKLTYQPIGVIHSPFKDLKKVPIQPAAGEGVQGWIEIFSEFKEGLTDLNGFSHLILLYHFHLSEDFSLCVKPFLDDKPRGLFATRSPKRPNAIGLSVVRLVSVDGCKLRICNMDMVDGSPLLDIKPYVPAFDEVAPIRLGWISKWLD